MRLSKRSFHRCLLVAAVGLLLWPMGGVGQIIPGEVGPGRILLENSGDLEALRGVIGEPRVARTLEQSFLLGSTITAVTFRRMMSNGAGASVYQLEIQFTAPASLSLKGYVLHQPQSGTCTTLAVVGSPTAPVPSSRGDLERADYNLVHGVLFTANPSTEAALQDFVSSFSVVGFSLAGGTAKPKASLQTSALRFTGVDGLGNLVALTITAKLSKAGVWENHRVN